MAIDGVAQFHEEGLVAGRFLWLVREKCELGRVAAADGHGTFRSTARGSGDRKAVR